MIITCQKVHDQICWEVKNEAISIGLEVHKDECPVCSGIERMKILDGIILRKEKTIAESEAKNTDCEAKVIELKNTVSMVKNSLKDILTNHLKD